MQYDIERKEYYNFKNLWYSGKYKHLRLGQAFYNHFNLHKMSDQESLRGLYNEVDGEKVQKIIGEVFRMV